MRIRPWIRNPAMLRQYLDELDHLRIDRAADAAALAQTVAVEVVPALACPQQERIVLQCRAIGILMRDRPSRFTAAPAPNNGTASSTSRNSGSPSPYP